MGAGSSHLTQEPSVNIFSPPKHFHIMTCVCLCVSSEGVSMYLPLKFRLIWVEGGGGDADDIMADANTMNVHSNMR